MTDRDSDAAVALAARMILYAELSGRGGELVSRCLDCGELLDRCAVCPTCGERRRRQDRDAHGHRDACYDPHADLAALCETCRQVVVGPLTDRA